MISSTETFQQPEKIKPNAKLTVSTTDKYIHGTVRKMVSKVKLTEKSKSNTPDGFHKEYYSWVLRIPKQDAENLELTDGETWTLLLLNREKKLAPS